VTVSGDGFGARAASGPHAWLMMSRRRGPRGQGGAPAAKRGRTTLTSGWRLLRVPRCGGGGRGGGWCRTRRHHVDRLAATLTCAGRNRSVFMRRRLPHAVHADDRPRTVVRRMTRGSVPAKAVADASCDRARLSPRADRRGVRAAVMVRRSSRPTRTRRVRGQPRSLRRCGGLCAPRGDGTVHTAGPGRPRSAQRLREGDLGGGAGVRG
jgi:hypothetical protein